MESDSFRSLLADFVMDAGERLTRIEEQLLRLEAEHDTDPGLLNTTLRDIHTLKGNAAMMECEEIRTAAHEMEEQLHRWNPGHPLPGEVLQAVDYSREMLVALDPSRDVRDQQPEWIATGVRVPFERVDRLVERMAEMVVLQNQLQEAVELGKLTQTDSKLWDSVGDAEGALTRTLREIHADILELRMIPLRGLFQSLKRTVRDEAVRLGKSVRVTVSGGETPIDKALQEAAADCLGHLARNAIVHGIESPEERERAGKDRRGTLQITATEVSKDVVIEVRDDGRGVDEQRLRQAASARKVKIQNDESLIGLLSEDGLSTQQDANWAAGRGVGLAAARAGIQRHGGRLEVDTEEGRGTCFTLRLPIGVSILRALLVRADGEEYAIPLSSVVQSQSYSAGQSHAVGDVIVLPWQGGTIELLDLGCRLGTTRSPRARGSLVALEAIGQTCGVVVDEIAGMRDVVVNDLDQSTGSNPGLLGSSIMGDGRVILILDPPSLLHHASPELSGHV